MRITTTTLLFILSISLLAQTDPLDYVDPMIGTARMGHTYPGATAPFGMVQLSPDTDTIPYAVNGKYTGDVYKYCAGYQYEDKTIVGFSHTHFSGTGHSDLGDFLIMPTVGELQLNPGTSDKPEAGYRSRFSHDTEDAEAGYYKVQLEDHDIQAELTATTRVGVHRYTFPETDEAHLILDMMYGIYNYGEKTTWSFIRMENDTLITGYKSTNGWARTRTMYFAMSLSKPVKSYGFKSYEKHPYKGFWGRFDQENNFPEAANEKIRAHFDFDMKEGEQLIVKVALSPVSTEGALKNLQAEAAGLSFDVIKQQTQNFWRKELNKVEVKTIDEPEMTNFYTAMYHAFLGPTIYQDVDGQYKGIDQNIHQANGFTNYTSFSLWDTYRALHPLFNVLQPARNQQMIQSMMAHYDQSVHKMLPIWSHHANENWCMIGYHSVPVIADAVMKGNADFDIEKAFESCVQTANTRYFDGIGDYIDMGYVPEDKSRASVSKTLEYAYDDWCIAQMEKKLGKQELYDEFMKRSESYKQVYDPKTGFMRPKLANGEWVQEFDPLDTHWKGFIEGNAWNYSLYVPHDPASMIDMMGGKKQFTGHLDSLFTMELPDKYFEHTEDISRDGIIGNYVHGNEPSHHVVYLFDWTDEPWRAQNKIRMILKAMYKPASNGLGGNDDFGQMSAWYLFSSLGFYPVAPGSVDYALGSPAVEEATIHLENGKDFKVVAKNQSDKNVYVSKVLLNGKEVKSNFLSHDDLMAGGELVFYMSSKPKKK